MTDARREEFKNRWREAQKLPYWLFIAAVESLIREYRSEE